MTSPTDRPQWRLYCPDGHGGSAVLLQPDGEIAPHVRRVTVVVQPGKPTAAIVELDNVHVNVVADPMHVVVSPC